MDPLEVLVRETAQNTCDAGLPDREIEYAVRLRTLSGNQFNAWRDFLLPEPTSSRLGLADAMERGPLIMTIADRGTTGLGGPLRADETPHEGERPDFVNFIRNVGERKNLDLGGGSYGFGKGILYNVSRCHMIVADSVCIFRGTRQRRLIAAALGDGYTHDGRRYTGRHWLGVREDDGHTRPLLDDEAEEMAQRLGLPRFADGVTGTTIAIVDADLGRRREGDEPRDGNDAAEFLASTMLWNLWPRMLRDRPGRLVCSVRSDGFPTEVPDPETSIELAPFVQAYRRLSEPGSYRVPVRKSPPTEIGRFAVVDAMAPIRTGSVIAAAAPFTGAAHHCARMRQADLVVDYFEGESTTDESIQYGAVFRASTEADAFFAEAEPPTHDTWVTNGLGGTALGVVRLANAFVREELRDRVAKGRPATPVGNIPLAALASKLSGLLAADSDAAEASTGSTRPGLTTRGGVRRDVPRFVEGPELVAADGRALIRGLVRFPDWTESRTVVARPRVVVDGGVEDPDGRLSSPEVVGWRSVEAGSRWSGAAIEVDRDDERTWELLVAPPPDAVVRIDLDVRATRS
ncbi:hypothetical protein ACQPZQ_34200 [Pseudonocardia sp. CA-142604]|uniref:hypothetical protein n=1 Tax=Pseudonocardia sp. CA-142604 TaxID=3240024 RepID=UPI003D8C75BB